MNVQGYCERCRRIRLVRVNFGRWTGKGVPIGICRDCAFK